MDKLLDFINAYKNIIYTILAGFITILLILYIVQISGSKETVVEDEPVIDTYEMAEGFLKKEFDHIIIYKDTKKTEFLEFFNKFDDYNMNLYINPKCFLPKNDIIADVMLDLYVDKKKVSELDIKVYIFYDDGKNDFKLVTKVEE